MMRWQERTALVSIPGFELHHTQLTLLSNIPKHVVKEFHAFLLQHLSVQKQKSASAFGQADWEPHEMLSARNSWKTRSEILKPSSIVVLANGSRICSTELVCLRQAHKLDLEQLNPQTL